MEIIRGSGELKNNFQNQRSVKFDLALQPWRIDSWSYGLTSLKVGFRNEIP